MKTPCLSIVAALALLSPAPAVMIITVAEDSPSSFNGWWSVEDTGTDAPWDMARAHGVLGSIELFFLDDPGFLRIAMWPNGPDDFSEDSFHLSETGSGGGYPGGISPPENIQYLTTWKSQGHDKTSGSFAMYHPGGNSMPAPAQASVPVSVPDGGAGILLSAGCLFGLAAVGKIRRRR